ncbi:hypothetical protein HDU99_002004 [Rhizoclosmatium hyalinum]|nr:hypothetical protein HDU99_002004 [Rhizoclosmatium hyalinum]
MATITTPPSCCALPAVQSNYTSKGEVIKVGDLDVYVVGPKGSSRAILVNYDIFGDHPCTRQVCDILSTQGFRVAMPDLCRGDPWPANIWPPPNGFPEVLQHIQKNASFPEIQKNMKATQEFLRSEGSSHFGLIGYCWGGYMVALLSQDPVYEAGAIVHPAAFPLEEAAKVSCPLLILPARDDAKETFDAIFDVVVKKNPASKQRRFDDVHHGFCAARADFSDALNAQRANEAIEEMSHFFKANIKA